MTKHCFMRQRRVFKIRIFFCTIYDRIYQEVLRASLTPLGVRLARNTS